MVDDRRDRSRALPVSGVEVVAGRGAGPAAARNLGWRRATAEWVAFLDDDVVPGPSWLADLARDLEGLEAEVAASQGRVRVPLPAGRRPTDWERNVRGLETARWATADMAYRRSVLEEVGGFDERFPRAYREDADLGLRVVRAGYRIVPGRRVVTHPVRVGRGHGQPAGPGGQRGRRPDAGGARAGVAGLGRGPSRAAGAAPGGDGGGAGGARGLGGGSAWWAGSVGRGAGRGRVAGGDGGAGAGSDRSRAPVGR